MRRPRGWRREAAGRLCGLLDAYLCVTRHESPAGRVRAPRPSKEWDESGPLPGMLEQMFGPDDEDLEDPYDLFRSLLSAAHPLLDFTWGGFGPTSSWARLELVEVGRGRWFVLWGAEDEGHRIVAALEPLSRETVSAAVADLLATNGRPYGIQMFCGMPSSIRNGAPRLLPAEVVKRGFRANMNRAARRDPACWVDLRNEILGEAIQPDPLERSSEALAEAITTLAAPDARGRLERQAERKAREGAGLTVADRRRILDGYFAGSYVEQRAG